MKYRLKYFNVTGLAEPIRYLFAYGNIEFEDYRLEFEEWKNYKERTPFGQIPVLEIDGKPVNQSIAICRYIAKQLDLLGKDEWEAFEIDMIVETLTDFRHFYSAYFREQNEDAKANMLKDIKILHNPYYLSKLEDIVKKNKGYFVGGQLTWADIYFAAITDLWCNIVKESMLVRYPALTELKEKVENIPNIKAYRDKRPETIV